MSIIEDHGSFLVAFEVKNVKEKLWRNEKEDVPWTNDTSTFQKSYFSFFAARASRTFASISSANSGLSFNKALAASRPWPNLEPS